MVSRNLRFLLFTIKRLAKEDNMSYDVAIGDWGMNMTSNIAPVFNDHLHGPEGWSGLHSINGLKGEEALPYLATAWRALNRTRCSFGGGSVGEPEMCAKYDSPNGWGSLVGALIFLGQLTTACGMYPEERIYV